MSSSENNRLAEDKKKAIAACKRYREIIKQYAVANQKLLNDFEAVCKTLNERMAVTQHLNEIIKEQEIKITRLATIIEERGLIGEQSEN